jgi:phosphohistidine phosphatase
MKTLYLMRHAQAVSAAPPLMGDHERFLTPQGTKDAIAVGKFMEARVMYPDFVLSSSSVRTIQTARLVFGVLFSKEGSKVSTHFDRKLFHASAPEIVAEIRMMDDSVDRLMVVAHNPGVADLARAFGKIETYAPGTLAVFRVGRENWADFSPEAVTLEEVFAPEG